MLKLSDRQWIGDETTAVYAEEEIVKRKASLRSVNDKHELMPINEIARKPSLKMPCDKFELGRDEKALTEKCHKPSDTAKLNISKSFQSTRTSNSSLLRSSRKREVKGCFTGIIMLMRNPKGFARFSKFLSSFFAVIILYHRVITYRGIALRKMLIKSRKAAAML